MLCFLLACLINKTPAERWKQVPIPVVPEAKTFHAPIPQRSTLPNGSTLLILPKTKVPVVSLSIALPGGYLSDQEKWGRASVVGELLGKSSGENNTGEHTKKLREQGAQIDVTTTEQHTLLTLTVPKENLPKALPLLFDRIKSPQFNETDWTDFIRYRQIELQHSYEDAQSLSYAMQFLLLYPKGHPRHRLTNGTPSGIAQLDRAQSKEWHFSRLDLRKIGVLATGDVEEQSLKELLIPHFESWPNIQWNPPNLTWEGPLNKGVYFIDAPQEQQSSIRVLIPAWKERDTSPSLKAQLLSIAMGGSFTSRLNAKLREEKGYTYGASCYFTQNDFGNILHVSTSVQRDVTTLATQDLIATLQSAQQGFSQEEWKKSKNTLRNDIVSYFEKRTSLLSILDRTWRYQRTDTFFSEQLQHISTLDTSPPNNLGAYFNPAQGIILILGSGAHIRESLQPLNVKEFDITPYKK